VEYLVETYDTDHKISFAHGTKEAWLGKQWLFFQTIGHAPHFGQAAVGNQFSLPVIDKIPAKF
jgi:glutathione S-transferase